MSEGQKLHDFESGGICLGYGWCGQTTVWDEEDHDSIFFNFSAVTKPILELVSQSESTDFRDFANNFRDILAMQITRSILLKGNWVARSDSESIARMLLFGYFKGYPSLAEIKVERVGSMPLVSANPLVPPEQPTVFSGCLSMSILNDLNLFPKTSEDAAFLIREYMRRSIDNPDCKTIVGGTVHIAKVTPTTFTWIDRPKNSEDARQ
jgi:hypothetical protein